MADFTELPVYQGVGDWHFNRFRVAFEPSRALNKQLLAKDFVNNFPQYVTSKYAEIRKNRDFGSRPTIHFHGIKMMHFVVGGDGMPAESVDIDVAAPHSDWVVKIDDNDNLGFTAQTLKREFRDPDEDDSFLLKVVPYSRFSDRANQYMDEAKYGKWLPRDMSDPVEINRMHFLAGRRSWRLDDGKNFEVDGDVLVLETCAVERFSHQKFKTADAVLGIQASIPDIWIAMLENFVRTKALARFPQRLRPGWQRKEHIYWYTKSFDSFDSLAKDREFAQQQQMKLYKTLLPDR